MRFPLTITLTYFWINLQSLLQEFYHACQKVARQPLFNVNGSGKKVYFRIISLVSMACMTVLYPSGKSYFNWITVLCFMQEMPGRVFCCLKKEAKSFALVSLWTSILNRPNSRLNSHQFHPWAPFSPEAMEVVAGEDKEPLFPPVAKNS